MAAGERCVFVSVNVAAHVVDGRFDWDLFDESVALAVRIADAGVELARVGAPRIVADRRRVGVGICGFHTALIRLAIPYAESVPLARTMSERLLYGTHRASADLAAQRGPFPAWETSRWRDPAWLSRKAGLRPGAVADDAWAQLQQRILCSGVRHAVSVAYPPTGMVSELLGVSKSYEPHFDLRLPGRSQLRPEVAQRIEPGVCVGDDGQVVGARTDHLLACARQLLPETHIKVHEAFSALADESGSKTVNLPADATVSQVRDLITYARERGLKGLTVYRDGCLSESESGAPR